MSEIIKYPKKIIIFSNSYTLKSAQLLKLNLENININTELFKDFINQDIIDKYSLEKDTYFFLFCPQAQLCRPNIKINLPKNRYFLYQIEQLNQNIFPYQNIDIIHDFIQNSFLTFDYSEINLKFYPEELKKKVKILKPFIDNKNIDGEKSIDILFIGTLSQRRNNILNHLKSLYNIVIVEKVFGENLSNLIKKSKIVLNLHTWDNALFELFRIHELLPYNIQIISEEGILEKSLMKRYENYIKLFPVIEDNLSNIDNLLSLLTNALLEKGISNRNNLINNLNKENLSTLKLFLKNQDYPTLLNKYHLNLSDPNIDINYNLSLDKKLSFEKRNFAHLHCYDLFDFENIYGDYLSNIEKLFNIIVTFSLDNRKKKKRVFLNDYNIANYTFLEIENKGYDIGGKFVMIQFLLNNNLDFDYILFLQSKRNVDKRKKYFEIIDDNNINNLNILMKKNYAGIFPSVKKFENFKHHTPFPNKYYVREILDYLNLKILSSDFFEGNCMILNKNIIQTIFIDNLKLFYNLLNNKDSFDINWIRWYYKPHTSNPMLIYNNFKDNNWFGNNLKNTNTVFLYDKFGTYGIDEKKNMEIASQYKYTLFNESLEGTNFADGMIEHAFERIFLNVILNKNQKYYVVGENSNINFEEERRKIYEEKRLQKVLELEKTRLLKEKLEKERIEKERLEKERIEKERLEKERLEKERLEKERLEKERLEKERIEKERLEKEKLEKERLEKERIENEKLNKERLENEKLEKERLEKQKIEKERIEKERLKNEKLEKERLEKERIEKTRLEKERLEKERLKREKLEKERIEKERLEKEKLEKERIEKERLEEERLKNENIELSTTQIIDEILRYNETNKKIEKDRKREYITSLIKEKNKLETLKNQKIKLNEYQSKILNDIKLIEEKNKKEEANKIIIKILRNKINEFKIRNKTKKSVENWKLLQEKTREENKTFEIINNKKKEIIEENRLNFLKREEDYINELERKELEKEEKLKKEKEELRNNIEIEIVEKEKLDEKEYLKKLFIEKIKNQSLRKQELNSQIEQPEDIDNINSPELIEKKSNVEISKEFINYLNNNIEIKDLNNKISNFIYLRSVRIIQKFIRLFLIQIKKNLMYFSKPRIALIYHYQATKNTQKNITNLSFFIKYGLNNNLWRDIDLTILLIINGDFCPMMLPYCSELIIWKNQKNTDDISSYKEGIQFLENRFNDKFYKIFNYLFLLNDLAFGPIMDQKKDSHWIDPFLNKLKDTDHIICYPNKNYQYNYLKKFTSFCSLIKVNRKIYDQILNKNFLEIFEKNDDISIDLIDNNEDDFFNKQIFIINNWIIDENTRNSYPIKYEESKQYYFNKCNLSEIKFSNLPINYKNLEIPENIYLQTIDNNKTDLVCNSKIQSYNLFGKSEEFILWNVLPNNNTCIAIYNHLSKENYLDDYIITSLKCLINLKYDIVFNTISDSIKNVDLPFEINYCFENRKNINNYMNFETLKKISSKYEWILLINSDILLPIHNFDNMKLSIDKLRNNNDYYGLYGNDKFLFDGFIEYKNKCIPTLLNLYKINLDAENIHLQLKNFNRLTNNYVVFVVSKANIKTLNHLIFLENKECFGIYFNYVDLENINYSEINFISKYIMKQKRYRFLPHIKPSECPIIEPFNILMRCTYRPNYFKKSIESILNQTYTNFKVIICFDDDNCLEYLEEYKNHEKFTIIKSREVDKTEEFYNLYCNQLLEYVREGWILFMDDDDMYSCPDALLEIRKNLQDKNDFLVWKFKSGGCIVGPKNINNIKFATIGTPSFCFYYEFKNLSRWDNKMGADFRFIDNLLKNKTDFNRKYINKVLVETQHTHHFGLRGKKEICKLKEEENKPYKLKQYETVLRKNKYFIVNNENEEIISCNLKFSIIMAYFNRKQQIILTLNQFQKLYANKYNFEVVIVDDCSNDNEKLNDILNNYSFEIKYIELKNKTWINPVVPSNKAILNISSDVDIVIFQNPETFHCSNILDHAKNIKVDEYFVYPVFNSPSYEENKNLKQLFENNCNNYLTEFINKIDKRKYELHCPKGWLQHINFNNRQLHFLSAISRSNLDKVGGFCNEMKDGLWFDDDDFLARIKKVTNCISVDSNILIGIHQKHSGGTSENMKTKKDHELKKKKYKYYE